MHYQYVDYLLHMICLSLKMAIIKNILIIQFILYTEQKFY